MTYKGNEASTLGGAVNCYESCNMIFDGDSNVTFSDNSAQYGGAMWFKSDSKMETQ